MRRHTRRTNFAVCLACLLALTFVSVQSMGLGGVSAFTTKGTTNRKAGEERSNTLDVFGGGYPWINLQKPQILQTEYFGEPLPKQELEMGLAEPLALAAGDFDEDGVQDLVCGYAGARGGILALHRGNVDSIYPNSPGAKERKTRGEFTAFPFLSPARVFELPQAVELLGTGDFDNDGHWDVVATAVGSDSLYMLPGDGLGGFGPARTLKLTGKATALVTGEINRADGLVDIVIGTVSSGGPQLLVFESPRGALQAEPEVFTLPAPARSLALAQLDEHYAMDLAVGAGQELLVVHGRDRRLSVHERRQVQASPAVVHQRTFAFPIVSIAPGDFIGDHRTEVALLSEDGEVHLLAVGDQNLTRQDNHASVLQTESSTPLLPVPRINDWRSRRLFSLPPGMGMRQPNKGPLLVSARLSSLPGEDLVLLDRVNRQLYILPLNGEQTGPADANITVAEPRPVSLNVTGEPMAVIPMRLNADALNDLVVLTSAQTAPSVFATAAAATFTVDSTGGEADCTRSDGICLTGFLSGITGECEFTSGCTLRAAIQQANSSPGADTINFTVTSVPSISLGRLDFIHEAVTIDGTTSPTGRVELGFGLTAESGSTTIRGLVINGAGAGIWLSRGAAGSIIEGNFIGTDVSGTMDLGNSHGISSLAQNVTIGGTAPGARNLISGNSSGVFIGRTTDPAFGAGTVIQGNFIGTDISGTMDLGNSSGISSLAQNVTIGGTAPGARNLISGNSSGVRIGRTTDPAFGAGSVIQGNLIGTDISGTMDLGNSVDGIFSLAQNLTILGNVISANSKGISIGIRADPAFGAGSVIQGNLIGTDISGTVDLGNTSHGITSTAQNITVEGNTIAFTASRGIIVSLGTGNTILSNSIFSTGKLGIDLGHNGVTPNDPGDGDIGANNLMNFPVISLATNNGANTIVEGTIDTQPGEVIIEFFSNTAPGPSGFGEGETVLGRATVSVSGVTGFIVTLPAVPLGDFITATATDVEGNTSEFSAAIPVTRLFRLVVGKDGDGTVKDGDGTVIIDSDPTGSNCRVDCAVDYPEGTEVTLTAEPDSGWEFDAWEGDCSGSGPSCTLLMDSDKTATAIFSQVLFRLRVMVFGAGTVGGPNRIACADAVYGPGCVAYYSMGDEVGLVAEPDEGWSFGKWEGCEESIFDTLPPGHTCSVKMDMDKNVNAFFTKDPPKPGDSCDEDKNKNGTPDCLEPNVESILIDPIQPVPGGLGPLPLFATVVSPEGTSLANVRAVGRPLREGFPPGVAFRIEFAVKTFAPGGPNSRTSTPQNGTTIVRLLLSPQPELASYWNFGPTTDDPFPHWYEFSYDGMTGAQILEDSIVLLHFVDGQRGDHDLIKNGEITTMGWSCSGGQA